ncbi:MAG: putative dienelactone hydrolase [Verrucomicrobiaceae bacterium]|nr:putative dienelactone hydrolase [Verrucomicrobiaceae bacterium]
MNRASFFVLILAMRALAAEPPAILPGTNPLTWTDDLSTRMHLAALHDMDQVITESVANRAPFWHRDVSSVEAYKRSIEPNREHFRQILGLVDKREPVTMEKFGDEANPAVVADGAGFTVYQVRWPVLSGVHGEGLLLEPKGPPLGYVVVVPDADQTPEQVAGLAPGVDEHWQFAHYLADLGYEVIVPTLVDRGTAGSGNADVVMTNEPHREWIHRQAYMMGRHLIGIEVQKVLGAIDWFDKHRAGKPVGIAGYGEGGLIAFYSAAVDMRIEHTLVSGYFKDRQRTWQEPLYRNVWGLLREFGDAEIASLIAPRGLLIEYCDEPKVEGPYQPSADQKKCAAPGTLTTPAFAEVEAEFNRLNTLVANPQLTQSVRLFNKADMAAANQLAARLMHGKIDAGPPSSTKDLRRSFDPAARQLRQVKEMEAFLQKLVRESDHTRNESFLYRLLPQFKAEPWSYQADYAPLAQASFIEGVKPYKQQFWDEVIGRINEPLPSPHPRTRKVYDEPKWTGYEVVLDVGAEGFTWGVLCVPKDIRPGEKRPVVVCQHGRHGLPKYVIEGDTPAYHNFAARLAEQGFITFAPHNLYNKEEHYRTLARKGNTVKLSMFSFILRHHEQLLNWLETLPMVDAKRIGFYGLSYGGESAARLPPLLDRYCLSICSGDFNDWTRKVASTDDRHSFMFTDEWEMPYFNMGSTVSYAELTYMMFPRPFMVERGHHDGVAPDEWVAYEFAKTRWLYSMFGLGDRTQIEFFNGGHTIHGQGTFEFLHKHLNWPAR